MRFALLCKRYYTNKDLMVDHFGRLFHLPVQLAKNGWTGAVIAADYRSRRRAATDLAGVHFHALPCRPLTWISFVLQSRSLVEQCRPDLIIGSGDTHFGLISCLLARRLGRPFIFDVYDDYTVFGTNRLPLMKLMFRQVVKRANLIICASPALMRRLRPSNSAAIVIQNGVDPGLFCPMPRPVARQRLAIDPGAKIVGYFGAINKRLGLETLLEAMRRLRLTYPGLRLLLAGRNELPAHAYGFDYVDYRGAVSQEDVPLLINACDVAVIPYHAGPQVDASNPCKLAEYLACGVPVAATRVTDIPDMLAELPEALCRPGDPADLARAIRTQLERPQTVPFPESLTWEALGKKLSAALQACVGGFQVSADKLHIAHP
jgi:glycosyltransferase involved in cell wall biosynthesis